MSTFLPLHPRMSLKHLEKAEVLHCGAGKNYCGLRGIVTLIRGKTLYIRWENRTSTMEYSENWCRSNLRVSTSDILPMRGAFNGDGFVKKYINFAVREHKSAYNFLDHATMKKKLEELDNHSKIRAAAEAPVQQIKDSKDEVGRFLVFNNENNLVGEHKTQRLAETSATKYTAQYERETYIVKMVAKIKPVRSVTAEVTQL